MMMKVGSRCCSLVSLAVVVMLVLASYITLSRRMEPAGDATHARVEIRGNIADKADIYREAIHQVHQRVKDKGDALVGFDDGELKRRATHVKDVCSMVNSPNISLDHVSYYKHLDLLYCHVPKAATKFWFRALHILETGQHKSPFEIVHGPKRLFTEQDYGTNENMRSIIQSAFKIVFARDPYQRIFSAYVDKFLSPNAMFWSFGEKIIKKVRITQPNTTLGCGEDVKFSELIRYLIGVNPKSYDHHFRPVSLQCDVCNIQYDVIGNVETFEHDAKFIFNQTHASERGMIIKDFKEENNINYIVFKVQKAFGFKKRTLKCISDHMVHRRVWRALQISGLINKYDDYPLSPDESSKANKTAIMNLMLRAYERSLPEAKLNKREALLQAYSQVPLVGLEQLRLIYLNDLKLFGYEERPSYLFDKAETHSRESQDSFDYFDILKLKV
ncbi:carbohydrate sulfotransferase 14-like [Haliotis cracherodii]|uniref:carbohydrate sulfotransferase 14-like n=1 Tax=Haliotis cracherodii TaxID=6455 RepID=UPI0039ED4AAC